MCLAVRIMESFCGQNGTAICKTCPADARRNNNVIMPSKRRHDVILTQQWGHVSAGMDPRLRYRVDSCKFGAHQNTCLHGELKFDVVYS